MWQAALFAAGFLIILVFSWHSLRRPRSHGFPRFFAFAAILGLIAQNAPVWFQDPFSPRQIASWLFLIGSAALAIHGFRLLRLVGRPQGQFENTTVVVREGAYRYIRHPLYTSLLLLAVGAFLKQPSWLGLALLLVAFLAAYATARIEEGENLARFGSAYAEYMRETKMFVPGVW